MERNRVLWVIFSISLFLVVVLAGGLYLLRPVSKQDVRVTAEETPSIRGFDAFEYVRGKSELPGLTEEPEEAEEMVIIVGEREEAPTREPPVRAEETKTAIPVPEKAIEPAPRVVSRPKTTRPAATVPVTRPVRKPAPQPAPREVSVTEYWIQAGSYTSPSRAQEVAQALEDQGLISKITTRALSGKTYYRVRIGPYQSKLEAEKFLGWVKAVKGFESSYISMVYTKRRVP
ncbi:MAG: SPOR domain-containing protein [Spirochaetales bacterium]|nr:SPOR domain-containing protein [Spirochaetales bacterium]